MDATLTMQEARPAFLRGAGLIALAGVVFLIPVVGFPGVHAVFDEDAAARAAGVEAHYANMWIGFFMFGISDLISAVGVLLFARALAATETGWRSRAARYAGPWLAVAYVVSALLRFSPDAWGMSSQEYVARMEDSTPSWEIAWFLGVWAALAVGLLAFAAVIVTSAHWPTWLGIVFGLLTVATLVTTLPLFWAVGGIVLGVSVWRRSWTDQPRSVEAVSS